MYGDRINQLDLRVGKILNGSAASRTLVALEIYNALNSSAVLDLQQLPSFRAGRGCSRLTILTPRLFKLTAEIDF